MYKSGDSSQRDHSPKPSNHTHDYQHTIKKKKKIHITTKMEQRNKVKTNHATIHRLNPSIRIKIINTLEKQLKTNKIQCENTLLGR